MRTLILGIGNTLLSDEGVGVHVLQALEPALPASDFPDVTLLDGGTLSFTLAGPIEDAEALIVVDAARIQGLEAGFTLALSKQLSWGGDLTLLHTRDKSTGKALNDRPRSSLASHLAWHQSGWDARVGLQYTGRQESYGNQLPAYTLVNLSAGRVIKLGATQGLNLRAGLENLGNVRLAEKSPNFGYAELGRRVFVSARLDF